MAELTAPSVLETRFISYSTPLELARRWARSEIPHDRQQAMELLTGLVTRFPHSIEIRQELAWLYLEIGDDAAAQAILDHIQSLCRNPNEEVLSRHGRIARDKGDGCVTYPKFTGPPEVSIGGRSEHPAEALKHYRLALGQYEKAYLIRQGHYPGVNVATLHLLIAAFEHRDSERTSHLASSERVARSLLARRSQWPSDQADDAIWHAASTGEIHLLLSDWKAACDSYRAAIEHDRCKDSHRGSMLKQVIRIVYCHKRLGVASLGAFDDLATVFQAP